MQRWQASPAHPSRDLGINPRTVANWRKRASVEDMKTGPQEPRSTVPSERKEAAVVAFRMHRLLPLDAWVYALQPSIPPPVDQWLVIIASPKQRTLWTISWILRVFRLLAQALVSLPVVERREPTAD